MYGKSFRKTAIIALTLLMSLSTFMLTGCGKSYEYVYGDVEWLSTYKEDSSQTEMKIIKDSYYYSDDWFTDDPSSENKELALASMQLAASCVSDEAGSMGEAFLKSMGFEEVGYSDFASSDPDDCNYTWARKTTDDSTLVAVVIQSGSANEDPKLRNKAWRQSFTVNETGAAEASGEHYAYKTAVDKVADDIAALAGDGQAAFWITGQSRGGAIANILAVRLSEKAEGSKIFAYTFEAPATVDAEEAGSYKFIHNYVCSDDIVTRIPLWGMTRYGVTHDLNTKDADEGLVDELAVLGSDAADMKPRIVALDAVEKLAANFEAKVPTRADYSAERTDSWTDADGVTHELTYSYQDAFVKLMDLVFSEDSSVSLIGSLASKRGNLDAAIEGLTEGVKLESGGGDPASEYWKATESLYSVLQGANGGKLPVSEEDLYEAVSLAAPVLITIPEDGGEPDTELLTDVIGYSRELTYSHQFDTIIARLKVLAPTPKK